MKEEEQTLGVLASAGEGLGEEKKQSLIIMALQIENIGGRRQQRQRDSAESRRRREQQRAVTLVASVAETLVIQKKGGEGKSNESCYRGNFKYMSLPS